MNKVAVFFFNWIELWMHHQYVLMEDMEEIAPWSVTRAVMETAMLVTGMKARVIVIKATLADFVKKVSRLLDTNSKIASAVFSSFYLNFRNCSLLNPIPVYTVSSHPNHT